MPDDDDAHAECYSREDIDTLVGIQELREMLSRGYDRLMTRSFAEQIAGRKGFPEPLIVYPKTGRIHMRLWLLRDVEEWLARARPRYREMPPKR